jgi:hypothetical protein
VAARGRGAARRAAFAALAVLLTLPALAAFGQAGQPASGGQAVPAGQAPRAGRTAQAILERGPVAVRGLPFLPPNVLEAYKAEYLAGPSRIEVYFTREPLVLPAAWRKVRCGQEALLRVEDADSPTFCHAEPGDGGPAHAYAYVLFLSFETEDFPWCAWTQVFLQSLRSLLSFGQGPADVPFPAVLDYPGG